MGCTPKHVKMHFNNLLDRYVRSINYENYSTKVKIWYYVNDIDLLLILKSYFLNFNTVPDLHNEKILFMLRWVKEGKWNYSMINSTRYTWDFAKFCSTGRQFIVIKSSKDS